MEEISIRAIAPYNETDFALNGGFFNCPNCNEQNYISESYNDKEIECCKCFKIIKFIE